MKNKTMTDILTLSRLHKIWPAFSLDIINFLEELGLAHLGLECDHTALRVNTASVADALSKEFCEQGTIISNNVINGRPILIIELNTPLQLAGFNIDCIELPYPGNKQYPLEGWEHIELVLPGNATTMAELEQSLRMVSPNIDAVLASDSSIKIKLSAPQAVGETLANPTIAFKQGDICIKVHSAGIKAVVASETAA
jgi:hypothetical protein